MSDLKATLFATLADNLTAKDIDEIGEIVRFAGTRIAMITEGRVAYGTRRGNPDKEANRDVD